MKRFFGYVAGAGLSLLPGVSQAAIDLTGFEIDMAPVEALLGVIVVAMGAMYVIRKFIKTGNRS